MGSAGWVSHPSNSDPPSISPIPPTKANLQQEGEREREERGKREREMTLGTSSTKQAYGEAWYWDNRYSQDPGPFDWYQKYPALSPLLDLYLLRYNRVLLVGCGNSGKSQIPHLQFPILSSPEISILINCERGVKVKVNSLFNF